MERYKKLDACIGLTFEPRCYPLEGLAIGRAHGQRGGHGTRTGIIAEVGGGRYSRPVMIIQGFTATWVLSVFRRAFHGEEGKVPSCTIMSQPVQFGSYRLLSYVAASVDA